jgi:hypothetical protein
MGTLALEIEPLPNARPGENVVAAVEPHAEAFRLKQMTQFREADVRVRLSAQQLLNGFIDAHLVLAFSPEARVGRNGGPGKGFCGPKNGGGR